MSSEELDEAMQDVGLNSKPGHRKRLVATIQMLSSQSKDRVPDCNMQDLPSSSTANTAEHVDERKFFKSISYHHLT